ncbi:MAG: hypothetical protein JSR91_01770 [Proteobacteria bacterium]|nr:hypothetical protein [Pseudomonadota bacterium]
MLVLRSSRLGSELGAGPNAYVCTECVEIFHRVLKPKPPAA